MTNESVLLNFPKDIIVESPSLVEAWLEIRWELERIEEGKEFFRDPEYPFAIGLFYNSVKERFPYKTDLESSNAPLNFFPYIVRHRFSEKENSWPLLQLGTGVISVNYTKPYDWNSFKETSLFLRDAITSAYEPKKLEFNRFFLRYRNALPVNFTKEDAYKFLKNNLNTEIQLPKNIPGNFATEKTPTNYDLSISFDLKYPKGTGTIKHFLGNRSKDNQKIALFQFEIASGDSDSPDLYNKNEFSDWLEKAHTVAHEWFFSTIIGKQEKEMGVKYE